MAFETLHTQSSTRRSKMVCAQKYVEVPDWIRAFGIEIIARMGALVAMVCVILATVPFLPILILNLAVVYATICVLFCIIMSEPLEKGLLIALLELVIA